MMIIRAALAAALTLSVVVPPLAAEAQQATKVYRIGRLGAGPAPSANPSLEAFRQGMREFGYIEGQNLVIEQRYAGGSEERLRDLAAELVRLKVDLIVAISGPATRAAQHATRTIPIVTVATPDPVGEGFVASLARPGGNITGLSDMITEIIGKQLEILKETLPQSTRIAALANPAAPHYKPLLNNLTLAARALGLQLHVVGVRRADELDKAFATMTRERADALIVFADPPLLNSLRPRIADLAAKHRLPAIYAWKFHVEAGGLMSYGPNNSDIWRRAATYVDKILKGAKPADLPVEQPTKFELVINLKTAKVLGLTIPPSLLLRADEIIQ